MTLRRIVFALVALVIVLEIAGYVSWWVAPALYDHVSDALSDEMVRPEVQKQFNNYLRTSFSPLTGWRTKNWFATEQKDCKGVDHRNSYGAHGERLYTGYDPTRVQMLLMGDSPVLGSDIDDDDTLSAGLYRRTGIISANLGGGGYDAVQSFLRATSSLQYFPSTQVVVLGIMYEDIDRIANSFRAVYLNDPALFEAHPVELMNFKPYIRDGILRMINLHAYDSIASYIAAGKTLAHDDYWAHPAHEFPFSLSLLRALISPAFIDMEKMQSLRHEHRQFQDQYSNKELGDDLFALLTLFAYWGGQHDIIPVAVFIPGNSADTVSPNIWLRHYRERLPLNLIVKNLGEAHAAHNFSSDVSSKHCHSYEYSSAELAGAYAKLIKRDIWLPRLLFPAPGYLRHEQ